MFEPNVSQQFQKVSYECLNDWDNSKNVQQSSLFQQQFNDYIQKYINKKQIELEQFAEQQRIAQAKKLQFSQLQLQPQVKTFQYCKQNLELQLPVISEKESSNEQNNNQELINNQESTLLEMENINSQVQEKNNYMEKFKAFNYESLSTNKQQIQKQRCFESTGNLQIKNMKFQRKRQAKRPKQRN